MRGGVLQSKWVYWISPRSEAQWKQTLCRSIFRVLQRGGESFDLINSEVFHPNGILTAHGTKWEMVIIARLVTLIRTWLFSLRAQKGPSAKKPKTAHNFASSLHELMGIFVLYWLPVLPCLYMSYFKNRGINWMDGDGGRAVKEVAVAQYRPQGPGLNL